MSCAKVTLDNLPEEVLLKIFEYVSHYDICKIIRKVCTTWNILSYSPVLWRCLDFKHEWKIIRNFINDGYADVESYLDEMLTPISDHVVDLKLEDDIDWLIGPFAKSSLFPNIRKLRIANLCQLQNFEGLIDILNNFPLLKEIHLLYSMEYSPIELPDLSFLENLDVIEFSFPKNSTDDVNVNIMFQTLFKNIPHVKYIGMDRMNSESVKILFESCRYLRHLNLAGCTYVGSEGFENMTKLDSLTCLNIDNTFINDNCLDMIVKNTPNLKHLSAQKCDLITDIGFSYIGQHCQLLESLILSSEVYSHGGNVTNNGLEYIAKSCQNLKVLVAKNCQGIDSGGLLALAKYCKNLCTLKVAGCIGISDSGIEAIANGCPYLSHTNFNKCVKITQKGFNHLIGKCIWLETAKFDGCSFLSNINLKNYFQPKIHKLEANDQHFSSLDQHDDSNKRPSDNRQCQGRNNVTEGHGRPNLDTNEVQSFDCYKNEASVFENGDEATKLGQSHQENCTTNSCHQYHNQPISNTEHKADISSTHAHSHLRKLRLKFCSNIGDDAMKEIAEHCPDLREVYLTGSYQINDDAIHILLKKCRFLKILDLSGGSTLGTSNFTDNVLISIAKYGKNIEELKMSMNFNITKTGVRHLLYECSNLKIFEFMAGFKQNTSYNITLEECQHLVADTVVNQRRFSLSYGGTTRHGRRTVKICFRPL